MIVEKRSSLAIFFSGSRLPAPGDLFAKQARNGNCQSCKEQDTHDSEREDPLESDYLPQELCDAKGCSQNTEFKAHRVVLVGYQEEASKDEDSPDGDVAKNASGQSMSIDCNCTIPVKSNESPSQGTRYCRDVDESRMSWMAEVEGNEIEEVKNQHELGEIEAGPDKEHDKSELEKVVEDEMTANGRGGRDEFRIRREQVPDVTGLEDEEQNPVNGSDDRVQRKGGMKMPILVPDASTGENIIVRLMKGIIDTGHDDQQPSEGCEESVSPDSLRVVVLPLDERVDLMESLHDIQLSADTGIDLKDGRWSRGVDRIVAGKAEP